MGRQATLRRQEKQKQTQKQTQTRKIGRSTKKTQQKFPVWTFLAIVVVIIAAVGAVILARGNPFASQATANSSQPDAAVDGISCDAQEQTLQHIHAHLTVYVNGSQATIPANIGIAADGSCYYWLHTHNIPGDSGVIHIEAPNTKTFTLGNFADIWRTQFSQLGYLIEMDQPSGWQAYVDGKPYNGDWRKIDLTAHEAVTLAYNSPNIKPDTSFAFPSGE